MGEIDLIPHRLDRQPVIVLGLTDAELRIGALLALAFWVPVATLIAALAGRATMGLAAGGLLALGSLWFAGKKLRVLKRRRPAGDHTDRLRVWLAQRGIMKAPFVCESRIWDIERGCPRRPPSL